MWLEDFDSAEWSDDHQCFLCTFGGTDAEKVIDEPPDPPIEHLGMVGHLERFSDKASDCSLNNDEMPGVEAVSARARAIVASARHEGRRRGEQKSREEEIDEAASSFGWRRVNRKGKVQDSMFTFGPASAEAGFPGRP